MVLDRRNVYEGPVLVSDKGLSVYLDVSCRSTVFGALQYVKVIKSSNWLHRISRRKSVDMSARLLNGNISSMKSTENRWIWDVLYTMSVIYLPRLLIKPKWRRQRPGNHLQIQTVPPENIAKVYASLTRYVPVTPMPLISSKPSNMVCFLNNV